METQEAGDLAVISSVADAEAILRVLVSSRAHKIGIDRRRLLAQAVLDYLKAQDRRMRHLEFGVQRLLLQCAEELGRVQS